MLEYKNFIFKNIIEKHTRKSNLYRKSKNLAGTINSDIMLLQDSQTNETNKDSYSLKNEKSKVNKYLNGFDFNNKTISEVDE